MSSILQTQTTSFKKELYQGVHDLSTDTIYIALYTAAADLNAATTVYSSTNEVVAAGYSPALMTGVSINTDGYTAYVNWDNVSWTSALTARCALIYNVTKGNKSIAVLDFGSDKTSVNSFTVQFPTANSSNAILRIA